MAAKGPKQLILEATANLSRAKTLDKAYGILANLEKQFLNSNDNMLHYVGTEAHQALEKQVLVTVSSCAGSEANDRYTMYQGICLEALILQQLAFIQLNLGRENPLTRSIIDRNGADLVKQLLARIFNYFNNPRARFKINHFNYTLNALVGLNLFQNVGNNHDNNYEYARDIAKAGVYRILNNPKLYKADDLIRTIHNGLLLDQGKIDADNIIPQPLVKKLLQVIESQWDTLTTQISDNYLDQLDSQLYIISNFYPDVFPQSIKTDIESRLAARAAQTHGSAFENVVFSEIRQATIQLSNTYKGLIDLQHFDRSNPLVETLGAEADILYESPYQTCAFQVDGEKYHCYPSSMTTTLKTTLRDAMFEKHCLPTVSFSDSQHSVHHAQVALMDNIVIPSFENKVRAIQVLLDMNSDIQALTDLLQALDQLQIGALDQDLVAQFKQLANAVPKSKNIQYNLTSGRIFASNLESKKFRAKLTTLRNEIQTLIDARIQERQALQSQVDSLTGFSQQLHHIQGQQSDLEINVNRLNAIIAKKQKSIKGLEPSRLDKIEEIESLNAANKSLEEEIQTLAREKPNDPHRPHKLRTWEATANGERYCKLITLLQQNASALESARKALKQIDSKLYSHNQFITQKESELADVTKRLEQTSQRYHDLMGCLLQPIPGESLLDDEALQAFSARCDLLGKEFSRRSDKLREVSDYITSCIDACSQPDMPPVEEVGQPAAKPVPALMFSKHPSHAQPSYPYPVEMGNGYIQGQYYHPHMMPMYQQCVMYGAPPIDYGQPYPQQVYTGYSADDAQMQSGVRQGRS